MTLLAIVAIHTAANEPPKVRQVMNKIHRNVAAGAGRHAPAALGARSYRGVLRKHGLRYVFPLFKTKMVSLRLMNFESPTVKVNDLGGCPVDMRAVVVWRVKG